MLFLNKKKATIFMCCFFLSMSLNLKNSHAVKIVAVVNEMVLTDVDVGDFSTILCVFQKQKQCDKNAMFSMSLMTLIDTSIKSEHLNKIGVKDKDFGDNIEQYKKQFLASLKMPANVNKDLLNWYVKTEFKWNAIVASMNKDLTITKDDIVEFKKIHPSYANLNEEQIKNVIFNYKLDEKSRSLVSEAKKYYLIDIKV